MELNKAESTIKNSIQVIFEKFGINEREKVVDILASFKTSTF